jgi:anti-sigma regulatory factor (Ser/Thr protein kinase)
VTREPGQDTSCLELAALPTAPRAARRHARAALHAWHIPASTIDTAELLASELTTNAITAMTPRPGGTGRTSITLRRQAGQIIIEVTDTSPAPPVPAEPGTDAETGRGLLLVQALAKEWGHHPRPAGGKTVYAVLTAEPDTAPLPATTLQAHPERIKPMARPGSPQAITVTARSHGRLARLRLRYPDHQAHHTYNLASARELLARTRELPARKRALLILLTEYRHALADITNQPTTGEARPQP